MTNSISEAILNGWAAPKRIWLHDLGCGDVTWCEDRDPDGEQIEAVEYLRADTITPPLDSEAVERIVTAIGVLRDEEGDPLNQYFTKAELNEIATAALTAMKEDDRG